eukprot:Pgem_evm1s6381
MKTLMTEVNQKVAEVNKVFKFDFDFITEPQLKLYINNQIYSTTQIMHEILFDRVSILVFEVQRALKKDTEFWNSINKFSPSIISSIKYLLFNKPLLINSESILQLLLNYANIHFHDYNHHEVDTIIDLDAVDDNGNAGNSNGGDGVNGEISAFKLFTKALVETIKNRACFQTFFSVDRLRQLSYERYHFDPFAAQWYEGASVQTSIEDFEQYFEGSYKIESVNQQIEKALKLNKGMVRHLKLIREDVKARTSGKVILLAKDIFYHFSNGRYTAGVIANFEKNI